MAPPAGQIRPGRYLAFFGIIVVALYALVFLTGDGKPTPKLGIDLQGGTRVTLTARTPEGGAPSKESLDQARQIIETRVNGIGVGGTEVVLDGDNVVITVPGDQGDQAKNLGKTAKLGFREVIQAERAGAPQPQPGQPQPGQPQPGQPGQPQTGQPGQSSAPAPNPSAPPASAPAGKPSNAPAPGGGGGAPGAAQQPPTPAPGDDSIDQKTKQEIAAAKAARQNPGLVAKDPNNQQQAAAAQQLQQQALAAMTCTPGKNDPLAGNDDPDKPLVTCLQDGSEKYVLGPVFLQGTEIADAQAAPPAPQKPGWTVNLQFKADGGKTWGDFTSSHVNKRAAFVLDTQVVSAPNINGPILGGNTEISGSFTQTEAKNLSDILKYGSLPLSFVSSDATTVSATLGLASLEAGLIAGAVGLAIVFVYCLFYYRFLGVLTILSLAFSGVLVYSVLVLLGRWIGYTLDLAGVAGLIIAIGITADSFVIYFERLKDEMREGRSFRSAVPRGWVRARRTILVSDAVSFLAAAVLYIIAVGDVRGFAFTLGMSTVLDLVVVYLVTHPLVAMISKSKSKTLTNPNFLGLGAVQKLGALKSAANKSVRRGATAKEA
ncbi:protein translocase subunit SecD [Amycolatopsis minnesotensis]|uniref:Protein translocase subunit SecD n=1 Tax=Amycolatopsis minnesotensis TaxID=337894 RepID=A0ABP5DFF7_9PSEU